MNDIHDVFKNSGQFEKCVFIFGFHKLNKFKNRGSILKIFWDIKVSKFIKDRAPHHIVVLIANVLEVAEIANSFIPLFIKIIPRVDFNW